MPRTLIVCAPAQNGLQFSEKLLCFRSSVKLHNLSLFFGMAASLTARRFSSVPGNKPYTAAPRQPPSPRGTPSPARRQTDPAAKWPLQATSRPSPGIMHRRSRRSYSSSQTGRTTAGRRQTTWPHIRNPTNPTTLPTGPLGPHDLPSSIRPAKSSVNRSASAFERPSPHRRAVQGSHPPLPAQAAGILPAHPQRAADRHGNP